MVVGVIEKIGKFKIESEKEATLRATGKGIQGKYEIKLFLVYYEDSGCNGHELCMTRTIADDKNTVENNAAALKAEMTTMAQELKKLIKQLLAKGWTVKLEEIRDYAPDFTDDC